MNYQKMILNTKTICRSKPVINALLIFVLYSVVFATIAHEHATSSKKTMAEQLQVEEPWARATFALATTGAAYFRAINVGDTSLVITSVSVTEDIAMMAELHHTTMYKDMMKMQQLEDGVRVNAAEELAFIPSGKHIMIMGLKGPLVKGESITITLHFSDESQKTIDFLVLDKRNINH